MLLPHGEAPADTHEKGKNIFPKSTDIAPLPPLREILGMSGRADVIETAPVQKLPIEVLTASLPGDVLIVKEGTKP